MYEVKVAAYSVGPDGQKLATIEWEFPRIVLAETRTHRVFQAEGEWSECAWSDPTTTPELSKSSASSRAIPYAQMLRKVREEPFVPLYWGKRGPGMADAGRLEGEQADRVTAAWLRGLERAIQTADEMHAEGVHKQDANRVLEPWAWVRQVVTAAKWDNFFALRTDVMAAPSFRLLARMAWLALDASTPDSLGWQDWHLPYIREEERGKLSLPDLLKLSSARCAWTSYGAPDGDGSIEKAFGTYQKLVGSHPVHASPTEHQAMPVPAGYFARNPDRWSNLGDGWLQHRKLIAKETTHVFRPTGEDVESWRKEAAGHSIVPYRARGG